MSNEELQKLIDERTVLLSELSSLRHVVHVSIFERYTVCSRPGCRCHRGEKHGPVTCMVSEDGRQRQKYVPKQMRELAGKAVEEYRRAQEVIDRISRINLKLISERSDA